MKNKILLCGMFFLAFATFFFSGVVQAQELAIRGTITSSEDGTPIIGATLLVQGGTNSEGTITDVEGKYSLSVDGPESTLVISSIGYQTKTITVGNLSVIDVQLDPDVSELSEVVVTAFGIEREKKALGYSVQEVNADELTQAREPNVVNSLKGKVAGVHINPTSGGPGGSSYVVIRGNSSLTGNNQPLYVVDGIPIDNQTLDQASSFSGYDYGDGIGNINPDDIENISVLKGPSAASMYGARGANGVILITTKSGKSRQGIGVEINSNYT